MPDAHFETPLHIGDPRVLRRNLLRVLNVQTARSGGHLPRRGQDSPFSDLRRFGGYAIVRTPPFERIDRPEVSVPGPYPVRLDLRGQ